MDVKKIFIILISVVACLFIGAFVLNTLLPNAVSTGINTIEGAIQNGTGIKLDINGDGDHDKDKKNGAQATVQDNSGATKGAGVGGAGASGFGISSGGDK